MIADELTAPRIIRMLEPILNDVDDSIIEHPPADMMKWVTPSEPTTLFRVGM